MAERVMIEPQEAESLLEEQAGQEQETEIGEGKPSGWMKLACGASVLLFLLIYLLRLDQVIGMFSDDAWYVLLAKALATGHGYTLINSPSPGIMPLYPPAFPFLLSLVFRLSPEFPSNLWLLKSVSIVAMLGVGIAAYRYFMRDRELPPYVALGIAVGSVLNPLMVVMATSTVMSECVFTLNFLLTVVVIERGVRASKNGQAVWRYAVLGAALASFAFLTRSVAVSLIAAVFLYLLKEKLTRAALIFAAAVAVFAGPWAIYARVHTPTPEQQKEQGGHIVQPYTTQFWQRRAGFANSGTVTVADLPERVGHNIFEIAGRDAGHLLVTPIFEQMRNLFEEARQEGGSPGVIGNTLILSLLLSALVITGFVAIIRERITLAEIAVLLSLGVTVLWPFDTARFVMPLLPFLLFYFLMGCRALHRLNQRLRQVSQPRAQWIGVGVMAALMAAVSIYGNVQNLYKRYSSSSSVDISPLQNLFHESETMCQWMNQSLPKDGVIATNIPPLIYLYTGRQTVGLEDLAENYRMGVRYLAFFPLYEMGVDPAESKYRTIYRTRGYGNFRVVDLGDPASRVPWNAPPSSSSKGMQISR